jgi:predicted translin family RNA/ssDNA-binding protein
LRAELIAHARLYEAEGNSAQAEDHRQAAMREEKELQELISEYTETYGTDLIPHGNAEFSAAALSRLANWRL